jgi:hypothetical protein
MCAQQRIAQFRILSRRVAKLEILGSENPFGLEKTSPKQIHQLGFRGAPLYFLQQPFSADEGWAVWPNSLGKHTPDEAPATRSELSFANWSDGSAVHGFSLLRFLPVGNYYLVRSSLAARSKEFVYVGNEAVRATPNMRVLLDGEETVHASIIGSRPDAAPDLDQPLLGVVICHATGMSWAKGSTQPYQHLVLFFPFADKSENGSHDSRDLTLIIPESGELVLDNLQLTTSNTLVYKPVAEDPGFRALWRDMFLSRFIATCSAEGASR